MRRWGTAIALWLGAMALTVFGGQNAQLVNVQLLGGRSPALPLGLVLVAMAGLGSGLVWVWPTSRPSPVARPRREPPRRVERPKARPESNRDWEADDGGTW